MNARRVLSRVCRSRRMGNIALILGAMLLALARAVPLFAHGLGGW